MIKFQTFLENYYSNQIKQLINSINSKLTNPNSLNEIEYLLTQLSNELDMAKQSNELDDQTINQINQLINQLEINPEYQFNKDLNLIKSLLN